MKKIKRGKNHGVYEPKKSSPEPQSDDEELNIDNYGRLSTKGYLSISIYHKMRKRQYGNRWMTQFVPLCREEVRRLEENGKTIQTRTESNWMQEYLEGIEKDLVHTKDMHGVTL